VSGDYSIALRAPRPLAMDVVNCSHCGELIEAGEQRIDVAQSDAASFHTECFVRLLCAFTAFAEVILNRTQPVRLH